MQITWQSKSRDTPTDDISGVRRICFKVGGGGYHCMHAMIDSAPCLKHSMSVRGGGGGGGTPTLFFSFLKVFWSIFQTRCRGTNRTSPTSLTSNNNNKNPQLQTLFFPSSKFFCQFSRHGVGVSIVHHQPLWQAKKKKKSHSSRRLLQITKSVVLHF